MARLYQLRIETCEDCPHNRHSHGWYRQCLFNLKFYNVFDGLTSVQPWCPIPEEKELKKSEK